MKEHGFLSISSPTKQTDMNPEMALVEFISPSASFHGVKKQSIKQLEWDILKVKKANILSRL